MTRTITAFFDSRSEAEAARQRLEESRIDADRIRIIDQGSSAPPGGSAGDAGDQGFWASLKELFMPDEDRHAYGEGIGRGGYLLSAEVDGDRADEAIRILDEADSVDFDRRQEEWRSSGWTGYDRGEGAGLFRGESETGTGAAALGATGGLATATSGMPLTGLGGRRDGERGSARVRCYVRESQESGGPSDRSALFGGEREAGS